MAKPSAMPRLRIAAQAPFAGRALLAFLSARAIPQVEEVSELHYRRFVRLGDAAGLLHVELDPAGAGVVARLDPGLAPARAEVAARLRGLFDLDARPDEVDAHLGRDPLLAPLVAATPGRRVPGAFDGWELAVRAILGQQVSVQAATTISGRLVQRFGVPGPPGAVVREFPSAPRLAAASADEVRAIGVPRARAATIVALAQALAAGAVDLAPSAPVAGALASLQALPGIGRWTARYIAMRALRASDMFLDTDLAVKKALRVTSPAAAMAASARWSPYRSYALMHLWGSLSGGG
jgi:AraC family transcriptional regulator of adaptative response / DNA-3-methyladenine glycosylase II